MRTNLWGKTLKINKTEILHFCHWSKNGVILLLSRTAGSCLEMSAFHIAVTVSRGPSCSSYSFTSKWVALVNWRYFSNTTSLIFAQPLDLSTSSGSWFIEHTNCKGPESPSNTILPITLKRRRNWRKVLHSNISLLGHIVHSNLGLTIIWNEPLFPFYTPAVISLTEIQFKDENSITCIKEYLFLNLKLIFKWQKYSHCKQFRLLRIV